MGINHTSERSGGSYPVVWIVSFLLSLTAVGLVVVFGREIGDWWERVSSVIRTPENFRAWVESLGAWGPVAFFIAQAIQVVLVPIPGSLFPPVGALAFGPWTGMGLSLAGMALGSALVFLVARRWGRPLAIRLVGADLIHRYEAVMSARGNLLIWLVFILPLLPDDALCALAGLSAISFRRFMLIATVGRIPAVAAGVFTMAGLEGAPAWVWILVTTLAAGGLWAGLRYRPVLEARLIRHLGREPSSKLTGAVHEQLPSRVPQRSGGHPATVDAAITPVERPVDPVAGDRLGRVLGAVVITTSVGVIIGVLAGVSGLASGIILVWGAALAVMVAWVREDD